MNEDEIFQISARRCRRCGGLLTSAESIRDGYGHSCKAKVRREELEKEAAKDQYTLFEGEGPGYEDR